jgi:dipeptidase E
MVLFKSNNALKYILYLINIIIFILAIKWLYDRFFYIPEYYFYQNFLYSNLTIPSSSKRNLLLCSNSTMPVTGKHFGYVLEGVKKFLAPHNVNEILVVTYAYPKIKGNVNTGETDKILNDKIIPAFAEIGIKVKILDTDAPSEIQQTEIRNAQAIYMTGGNTFWITRALHKYNVINVLREKVFSGMPYIGVSSGTNVTSPTMQTTNDMPICCIPSCDTLGLIPFQLNVHFNELKQGQGFSGESRTQRICQYIQENRTFKNTNIPTFVLGLQEGTCLHVSGDKAELVGLKNRPALLMQIINGEFNKTYISPGTRVDNLLKLDTNQLSSNQHSDTPSHSDSSATPALTKKNMKHIKKMKKNAYKSVYNNDYDDSSSLSDDSESDD